MPKEKDAKEAENMFADEMTKDNIPGCAKERGVEYTKAGHDESADETAAVVSELSDDQVDKTVGGIYEPKPGGGWWALIETSAGRFAQCVALEDTEENIGFFERCYHTYSSCPYYSGPDPTFPTCKNQCQWLTEGKFI